jgi:hypothetical protein
MIELAQPLSNPIKIKELKTFFEIDFTTALPPYTNLAVLRC